MRTHDSFAISQRLLLKTALAWGLSADAAQRAAFPGKRPSLHPSVLKPQHARRQVKPDTVYSFFKYQEAI
ncbi:MAG: hypothetical protein L6Q74_15305 [Sphaerotilus natans subsp. sulfidivorans]|uniref:hypothetical protein n=1 Tax=Sphaerotilus sulfidivorans TaxID=639200 RepID=UPI0023578418|nr:hypothetical protein [Sphaerotilus sulfidivorans]MCK6403247.1 hypothetical protein [Sphaerotilus sulfidivorans]